MSERRIYVRWYVSSASVIAIEEKGPFSSIAITEGEWSCHFIANSGSSSFTGCKFTTIAYHRRDSS